MNFRELPDLLSARLGGAVVWANDEFFAPKENLIKEKAAVFEEGRYTERGKWMDGWETRRRREPGHDRCIVRLGAAGRISGVVVDTAHFRGNHPEHFSLDGLYYTERGDPTDDAAWVEVVPRTALTGDDENEVAVADGRCFTHLRLHIYPDGGVARLRVHGEPTCRWSAADTPVDLAAVERGGRVLACSDAFFSTRHNLILPGNSRGMFDGWETRRRSSGDEDWVVVQLAAAGRVTSVVVDTSYFKGNAPAEIAVEASADNEKWSTLVPKRPVEPHDVHEFADYGDAGTDVRYVKLRIFPDGGVARLRILGHPHAHAMDQAALEWLNALPTAAAQGEMLSCCGSTKWAGVMTASRPILDRASLFSRASEVWNGLEELDWLEAFAAHPRIGERSSARFSDAEQAGAAVASPAQRAELVRLNEAYEEKHDFVFLICATGKSVEQILAALKTRLSRSREEEIRTAATEQASITELRLEKVLRS